MPVSDDSILLPKPVIESCYASIFRCYQEMFPTSFTTKTALTRKLSTQHDISVYRLKPLGDEAQGIPFTRSPRNSPRSSLRESGKNKNPLQMMASLRRSFRWRNGRKIWIWNLMLDFNQWEYWLFHMELQKLQRKYNLGNWKSTELRQ